MNSESNTVRSLIFPREEICNITELYFRTEGGSVDYCEKKAQLRIRGTAAFDTFYNVLPFARCLEYCKLSSLFLRLRVCGSFRLRIYGTEIIGGEAKERLIAEKKLSYSVPSDDITDISSALGGGFGQLYFTLTSDSGTLYGGEYATDTKRINKVKIAAVICTYKREKFLLRNHREICAYLSHENGLDGSIHFYIVDNGQTLEKSVIENEYVTLIPNENTGGSGGFTRGYREAVNSGKGYTHILFMDDDIVLDCNMLKRVCSLLEYRSKENDGLAVGGAMLLLSDRVTQHEAGALWDGKRLTSIGKGQDMTLRESVFSTALYPPCSYNAWWFYCFPAYWQEKHGYPLQFFVKEDDIEYSLRCAGTIAVPCGIAVWHDDFEGKYDGFQEYYIKRNELILTSVNAQKPYALFQVRKLILSVMKQTVFQRYFLADIIFRAYDDYLRGWKHFLGTDTAALNRELMASCLPLLDDDALSEKYGVRFDKEKYDYALTEPENLKKQALSMNGYLIPKAFYNKDSGGYSMTNLARCRIVNFYKHSRVLHYDTDRRRGFVTVQKKTMLWKNIFRLICKTVKFLLKYPFVRRGYRKHLSDLAK